MSAALGAATVTVTATRTIPTADAPRTLTGSVVSSDCNMLSTTYTEVSLPATSTVTATVSSQAYTPGWCGVHVSQYLRNKTENPSPDFKLNFRIFDGAQALIATFMGVDASPGHTTSLVTLLPTVLNVTTQNADDDPVLFEYNGVNWDSSIARHCHFGGYDASKREGDCGFTCN